MPRDIDLKALKSFWANANTQEELDICLDTYGIGMTTLRHYAEAHSWEPGPIILARLASLPVEDIQEATPEFIDATNKAAVRQLTEMHQIAIARLHGMIKDVDTPPSVLLSSLGEAIKNIEKLIRIERPMWGLSTTEPPGVGNPINIFMDGDSAPAIESNDERAPE